MESSAADAASFVVSTVGFSAASVSRSGWGSLAGASAGGGGSSKVFETGVDAVPGGETYWFAEVWVSGEYAKRSDDGDAGTTLLSVADVGEIVTFFFPRGDRYGFAETGRFDDGFGSTASFFDGFFEA